MMLVKVLEFGSNWWARFGSDPKDPWRFTRHAAYYNSAGLLCGRKVRRHWIIPGLIRFNAAGGFGPRFSLRSIGTTFSCDNLNSTSQGNRLLVTKKAAVTDIPDYFLVVISNERHGVVDVMNPGSVSETVIPIAASELHQRQELVMLMRPAAWIHSSVGVWELAVDHRLPNGASLRLTESKADIWM